MRKTGLILGIAVSFILISFQTAFSQEGEATAPSAPSQEPVIAQTQIPAEPETQWVWGEVVSADTQKNEILVKYLEYETDEEKEIAIGVDDKTTYENVKSLAEIKSKDTLSIDYIVTAEGKNMARSISAEQSEAEPQTTAETAPEITPETLTPQQ